MVLPLLGAVIFGIYMISGKRNKVLGVIEQKSNRRTATGNGCMMSQSVHLTITVVVARFVILSPDGRPCRVSSTLLH
jgi:hypothetical protein